MSSMRNPFKMRASEKIESDVNFISLYSPEILLKIKEINEETPIWNYSTFFISSPGGGKTSLLRLFSPTILDHIYNRKDTQAYKEIYTILNDLEVLDDHGCKKIGVYYLCSRNYSLLEDEDIYTDAQSKRYFFALLNARIIISTLQSIISFHRVDYSHLKNITFNPSFIPKEISSLNFPCTGQDLFSWAELIENEISEMLDSFDPNDLKIAGHENLFVFKFLNANFFQYNENKICEDFIFQLDDFHKLTDKQREYFKDENIETRNNATIWIAERLEGFSIGELLEDNNALYRDYRYIRIEDLVKPGSAVQKKFYTAISDKRAQLSTENINSFKDYLEEEYLYDNGDKFLNAYNDLKEILVKENIFDSYSLWISLIECKPTYKEKASYLRAVKIHIEREEKKRYLFPIDKSQEEFEIFMKPDLIKLCESFLRIEYNIPLYFSFEKLNLMSSNNVEQFINIAGDLFDSILLKKIRTPKNLKLSCEEQHAVIVNFSKQKYKDLVHLPNGPFVKNLLDRLIRFAQGTTYDEGSSYRVVTGFAILEENRSGFFQDDIPWFENKKFDLLANVIQTCLAYNIFEMRSITQGDKNQQWSVFYFNRWICAFANLPLNYGGWRKISIAELNKNLSK